MIKLWTISPPKNDNKISIREIKVEQLAPKKKLAETAENHAVSVGRLRRYLVGSVPGYINEKKTNRVV